MTAATRTLIFAHGEIIKMDAMHRNKSIMLGSERNEHVSLENTVYCQIINLINDPLMKHEIQPQCL